MIVRFSSERDEMRRKECSETKIQVCWSTNNDSLQLLLVGGRRSTQDFVNR